MQAEANDPLVVALRTDNIAQVEEHMRAGRRVDERFHFSRTPLHVAAESAVRESAEFLLKQGADLEAHDEAGHTPLIYALQAGHESVAKTLINAGARLRYSYKPEDTPEARARQRRILSEINTFSHENHPQIFELIDSTMSEKEREQFAKEMENSLLNAVFAERKINAVNHCTNIDCLKLLSDQPGVSFNVHDGAGYWPLKQFAESGDVDVVRWLLANGADPNFTSTGDTALHSAVMRNHFKCARLLLDAGADPNQQDVDGCVPMWRVASDEMLDLLLANGADPTIGDQCGMQPSGWVKDQKLKARLLHAEQMRQTKSPSDGGHSA